VSLPSPPRTPPCVSRETGLSPSACSLSSASLGSTWSEPVRPATLSPLPSPTPASPPRAQRKKRKIVGSSWVGSPLSSLTPNEFGVAALNGQSCLSVRSHLKYEPQLLRLMLALNLSVLAIADSGTRQRQFQLDNHGMAVRSHQAPDGSSFSFHAVMSPMGNNLAGKHQLSGSGVSLFWDSRIPFENPWRDTQGRAAAVTLNGTGSSAPACPCCVRLCQPRELG
jgi:hypothetical protein